MRPALLGLLLFAAAAGAQEPTETFYETEQGENGRPALVGPLRATSPRTVAPCGRPSRGSGTPGG
jgi:hypothetical protein